MRKAEETEEKQTNKQTDKSVHNILLIFAKAILSALTPIAMLGGGGEGGERSS